MMAPPQAEEEEKMEEFRPSRPHQTEEECAICKGCGEDAWLLPCEHRVCSGCAHRLITNKKNNGCPFCRRSIESAIVVIEEEDDDDDARARQQQQ